MLPFSAFLFVALVVGSREPIADAKPLRRVRLGQSYHSISNDENPYNIQSAGTRLSYTRQNVQKIDTGSKSLPGLTYVASPPAREKRDTLLDEVLSLDDVFSMASSAPSGGPTPVSSDEPSLQPSEAPSVKKAKKTSLEPTTTEDSSEPTSVDSSEPTSEDSFEPTSSPSEKPVSLDVSEEPSTQPSKSPTENPDTAAPSESPTETPDTPSPTAGPTETPSTTPTTSLTASPTETPSVQIISNFTDDDDELTDFPSSNPSSPPTLGDCLITPQERTTQIFALLDNVGNSSKIRDLTTPQGLAADWLIQQDFRKECPSEKIYQRWVIAVFYFATGGESWLKCSAAGSDPCGSEFPFVGKRRFLSDFSECEWAGITCNFDDCVTEIEFENNDLIGTIPTELGLLTDLVVLGMERGGLTSTIPSEIGLLSNLVFIDFDFNELTGSLPNELYSLTDLNTLDLNDNFLTGDIDNIGVFEKMEWVQLQKNQFTGTIPEDMGNLTMMTTFNLHENMFTGVIPDSICELRDTNGGLLKSLVADCLGNSTGVGDDAPEIECDCCSTCKD